MPLREWKKAYAPGMAFLLPLVFAAPAGKDDLSLSASVVARLTVGAPDLFQSWLCAVVLTLAKQYVDVTMSCPLAIF